MPLDWVNRQDDVDFVLAEDVNTLATAIIENENQIANKQDILIFDTSPALGSTNPVTSNGIQDSLDHKASISWVEEELNNKQDTLTFDTTPRDNSSNPVTSTGVKTALNTKLNKNTITYDEIDTVKSTGLISFYSNSDAYGNEYSNAPFSRATIFTTYAFEQIFIGFNPTYYQIAISHDDSTMYRRIVEPDGLDGYIFNNWNKFVICRN